MEQLETVLRLHDLTSTENSPVYLERPEASWQEFGATPYLRKRQVSTSATTAFLGKVAGVEGEATLPETESTVNSPAEGDSTDSEAHTTPSLSLDDEPTVDPLAEQGEHT